jgi:hypothetical protein
MYDESSKLFHQSILIQFSLIPSNCRYLFTHKFNLMGLIIYNLIEGIWNNRNI